MRWMASTGWVTLTLALVACGGEGQGSGALVEAPDASLGDVDEADGSPADAQNPDALDVDEPDMDSPDVDEPDDVDEGLDVNDADEPDADELDADEPDALDATQDEGPQDADEVDGEAPDVDGPDGGEDVRDEEPELEPPPSLHRVELGIDAELRGVWAQDPGRVFIAGDVPVQIQAGVASYWPLSDADVGRALAVTGGQTRGTVFAAERRPGVLGRFAQGQWRSIRFARVPQYDDISMVELGSRELVIASSPDDGLVFNSFAQDRQSGWQLFLTDKCPGEPLGTRREPCPVDSSFALGGDFDREVWISAEGRLIHLILSVQDDFIQEEVEGTAHDIFATPDGAVFAVGPGGALIWKVDGAWSRQTHPSGLDLHGVWAASAQEAWAVGDGGLALRFDGRRWVEVPTATEEGLRGVYGAGEQRWIVGTGGTLLWTGADGEEPPSGRVEVPTPPDRDPVVRFLSVADGAVLLTCAEGNVQVGNDLDHVGNASGRFVHGYASLSPGQHRFWVDVLNVDGCRGLDQGAVSSVFQTNDARTFVVEELVNFISDYTVFDDDLTPPVEFDGAKARVLNFAQEVRPDLGEVDVCTPERVLGAGIGARQASAYFEVPAEVSLLQLKVASEPPCTGALLQLIRTRFQPGAVHTLTLMEDVQLGDSRLAVLSCVDGSGGLPDNPSVCVRDDYDLR